MFDFGRELRRRLGGPALPASVKDGLTGGDVALLELLDLRLLLAEARGADVVSGRVGVKDGPVRLLEAAVIWREVARRSGDAAALRKAAATAQSAAEALASTRRSPMLGAARVEQAFCAMLGAELYGDDGLNAAAEVVLTEVAQAHGGGSNLARAALAGLQGRRALGMGRLNEALAAAERFEQPLASLSTMARSGAGARLTLARQKLDQAEILLACAMGGKDAGLARRVMQILRTASVLSDSAYEPLTFARTEMLRGQALALLGDLNADPISAADGVSALAGALETVGRDHSPLDWVRIQMALGESLQTLGAATDAPVAFEKALTCFDRAGLALRKEPALIVRATLAGARARCLARHAEHCGDLAVLDAAEAAYRSELSVQDPSRNPVAWAVTQLGLARLYETRADLTGASGALGGAALALSAAEEVFAEAGLPSLTRLAIEGLERLRLRGRP